MNIEGQIKIMKESKESNCSHASEYADTTPKNMGMTIQQKKKILHDYILLKLEENDLHGISDAANDLRVIEAYHAGMDAAIDLQRLQDRLNTCEKAPHILTNEEKEWICNHNFTVQFKKTMVCKICNYREDISEVEER